MGSFFFFASGLSTAALFSNADSLSQLPSPPYLLFFGSVRLLFPFFRVPVYLSFLMMAPVPKTFFLFGAAR